MCWCSVLWKPPIYAPLNSPVLQYHFNSAVQLYIILSELHSQIQILAQKTAMVWQ